MWCGALTRKINALFNCIIIKFRPRNKILNECKQSSISVHPSDIFVYPSVGEKSKINPIINILQ